MTTFLKSFFETVPYRPQNNWFVPAKRSSNTCSAICGCNLFCRSCRFNDTKSIKFNYLPTFFLSSLQKPTFPQLPFAMKRTHFRSKHFYLKINSVKFFIRFSYCLHIANGWNTQNNVNKLKPFSYVPKFFRRFALEHQKCILKS